MVLMAMEATDLTWVGIPVQDRRGHDLRLPREGTVVKHQEDLHRVDRRDNAAHHQTPFEDRLVVDRHLVEGHPRLIGEHQWAVLRLNAGLLQAIRMQTLWVALHRDAGAQMTMD